MTETLSDKIQPSSRGINEILYFEDVKDAVDKLIDNLYLSDEIISQAINPKKYFLDSLVIAIRKTFGEKLIT